MNWIHENAAALSAAASIFSSCATFIIIIFNINQLKQNNRSFNVDINFKVFEMRKKIYQDIITFIKNLDLNNSFRNYLTADGSDYITSDDMHRFKHSIENSKYLFSAYFAGELELLLLSIEQGIAVEKKIAYLKDKDPSLWLANDQEEMRRLGNLSKEYIASVLSFKTEEFLAYLDVSNFHRNLMDVEAGESATVNFPKLLSSMKNVFINIISLVKNKTDNKISENC